MRSAAATTSTGDDLPDLGAVKIPREGKPVVSPVTSGCQGLVSNSSNSASARGSPDWPSQNSALRRTPGSGCVRRSEEHTSALQSQCRRVYRLPPYYKTSRSRSAPATSRLPADLRSRAYEERQNTLLNSSDRF